TANDRRFDEIDSVYRDRGRAIEEAPTPTSWRAADTRVTAPPAARGTGDGPVQADAATPLR
ncbi:MAG: hypothetical protein DMG27_22050, partial [Acidobacteria bacterium]